MVNSLVKLLKNFLNEGILTLNDKNIIENSIHELLISREFTLKKNENNDTHQEFVKILKKHKKINTNYDFTPEQITKMQKIINCNQDIIY